MAPKEETRTPAQVAQHRAIISRKVLRGKVTQEEIAAELGISQSTVSRDIKALRKEWRREAGKDFIEYQAEELAASSDLIAEWWDGWDRSKQDAITQAAIKQKTSGGNTEKAERETENRVGDPRFLTGVSNERLRRQKLLGLGTDKDPIDVNLNTSKVMVYLPDNGRDKEDDGNGDGDTPPDGAARDVPQHAG